MPGRLRLRRVLATLVATLVIPAAASREAPPVQLWDVADLRVRPGVTATVAVRLTIAEGHAVVGAGVRHASLRPLQLRMQPAEGVRFGAPSYPRPQPAALLAGAAPVLAHTGVVEIRLPIQVSPEARWSVSTLRGALRYQACRAGRCDAQQALPVTIEVETVREAPAR